MAKVRTADEVRKFVFGMVDTANIIGTVVDRVTTDTTMTITVDDLTPKQLLGLQELCNLMFAGEGYEGIQINFSSGTGSTYQIMVIIPDDLLV